jgi:HAD superfamily hydrolase (TIGR01509 family)
MSLPAAVIFDNDGLTLDSEELWTEAEEKLFAAHEIEFNDGHKIALLGNSGPHAATILARELGRPDEEGPALVEEMNRLVYVALEDGCEPMPGAVELLTALGAAGVPVALCSNSPRGFVDRAIAAAGVADFFGTIVTAEDVPLGKPAPDPYLEAARRLGAAPGECVALEDSPPGAASAAAAGMTVYVIPSFEDADFAGAEDRVFSSLADPELLAAIGLDAA